MCERNFFHLSFRSPRECLSCYEHLEDRFRGNKLGPLPGLGLQICLSGLAHAGSSLRPLYKLSGVRRGSSQSCWLLIYLSPKCQYANLLLIILLKLFAEPGVLLVETCNSFPRIDADSGRYQGGFFNIVIDPRLYFATLLLSGAFLAFRVL